MGLTAPREFRATDVSAPACRDTLGSHQTAGRSAWSALTVHRTWLVFPKVARTHARADVELMQGAML